MRLSISILGLACTLALAGCGSDDGDDGSGGSEAGEASAGDSTGSADSTASTDSGDSGGSCSPGAACDQCVQTNCSDQLTACATDTDCAAVLACIEAEQSAGTCDLASCYEMQLGAFTDVQDCISNDCAADC